MPYPIHNWKDSTKYLPDPLAGAPAEFIVEHQELHQSDDDIRAVLWRWQFLRRHSLYQANWQDNSEEYTELFDIGGTKRPDPKTDYPAGLIFSFELFAKDAKIEAQIDLRLSWAENARNLKKRYDLFMMLEPTLALPFVARPESAVKRERQLGEEKYPNLLRVLDALAAKASLTEIAEKLRGQISSESLTKTSARWRGQALDLQVEMTRLPRMELQEK